jgi:hypothetical protein
MKIIRTANLNIIKTQILGGQIDAMGNCAESDHSFTRHNDHLKIHGHLQWDLVKMHIQFYINQYGDNSFEYYGDTYKLKHPSIMNMNILTDRIFYALCVLELTEEN